MKGAWGYVLRMHRGLWPSPANGRFQGLLVLALTAASTSACEGKKTTVRSPVPQTADAAPLDARAAPDAGDRRAAVVREPSLLDIVPAKVAVSSVVQNPRDFPEHLIDGRADTAWNSRTGDVVGAWISFRIPRDAHVSRIEMSSGFDKRNDAIDLFTANHRVTKVSIRRDGKKLGDFSLDPTVRTPQAIPVDGPGGDYEIKVVETLPGSKKEWRELAVSELRVIGTPGAERAKEPARVSVGSLDEKPGKIPLETVLTSPSHVYENLAAVCAVHFKQAASRRARNEKLAQEREMQLAQPSCNEIPVGAAFEGDAIYKRARAVRFDDGLHEATELFVEIPAGLASTGVAWNVTDPQPGHGCMIHYFQEGYEYLYYADGVRSLRIENGHFVVVIRGSQRLDIGPDGTPLPRDGAAWCRLEGEHLSCKGYDPRYHGHVGAFAIAPDGTLRLQGSRDAAAPVRAVAP